MNDIAREHENAQFKLVVYEAVKEKSKKYMEEAAAADIIIPYESTQQMKKVIGRKLLKRQFRCSARSTFKVLRRVTVVIAVIFTLFFGVTMSVEALRVDFTRFLLTFYPEYTQVELETIDHNSNIIDDGQSIEIVNQYIPTYIPDGFTIKSMQMFYGVIEIYYENDGGQYISFTGYSESAVAQIDTENADVLETVEISGNPGLLSYKEGTITVTWSENDFFFVVFGNLEEKEVLNIANSVIWVEK